jgi:hypothetical protein
VQAGGHGQFPEECPALPVRLIAASSHARNPDASSEDNSTSAFTPMPKESALHHTQLIAAVSGYFFTG